MMTALLLLVVSQLQLLSSGISVATAAHAEREMLATVTVNVTVLKPDGSPVQGLAMGFIGANGRTYAAFTDASGVASRSVTVTSLLGGKVVVYPTPILTIDGSFNAGDQAAARQKFDELTALYALPTETWANLQPNTTTYSVQYEMKESVTVKGKVDGGGFFQKLAYVGTVGYFHATATMAADGKFEVKGVPKSTACRLYVNAGGGECRIVDLTAAQTASLHDVGTLTFTAMPREGQLSVTLSQREAMDRVQDGLESAGIDGVTFVSTDGLKIYTLFRNLPPGRMKPDGRLVNGDDEGAATAKLPAGTYYMVPGLSGGERCEEIVVNRTRSGAQATLDQHNVPKITVVAGQTVTTTYDFHAAYLAIIAAY